MSRKVAFIVSRVVGFLVFVALIVGGGAMAYRAGVAQGVVQAPAVATAISQAAENGQAVPPMMYGYGHPYPYGYGYGMHGFGGHHFGFFPLGGICFSIFFLFLFFGFMKMIFFRRMWGGHHMHGPWGKGWEGGAPPMFNEWHKRAHDEKPAEEGG
ncbi:MAG: hypothetical protein Q7J80_15625 [Anaerolineales bacterium]|nr:hypothetical protein [Anaerolineales bacterium]MDO8755327.1 hypothetical protein [Anaerolineales bacterium]